MPKPPQAAPAPYESYQALVESSPHPMWVFDEQTLRVVAVNEAAVSRYGYSRPEFLAMTIDQFRPPQDTQALRDRLCAGAMQPTYRGIWRHVAKSGDIFDVDVFGRPVTFGDRPAHIVAALDIPDHERTTRNAQIRTRRLQSAFDHALDAIVLFDNAGRYVEANPAAAALLGYSSEEMLTMDVWSVTPAEQRQDAKRGFESFRAVGRLSGSYELVRKDGTRFEAEFRAVADILPGVHLGVMRDVSVSRQREAARALAEQQVAKTHEQIRRVAARARSLREEERRRLSRELHDQLGQALTGLKIDLSWIANRLAETPGLSSDVHAKTSSMLQRIDHTIQSVRRIATELRPSVLDKLGLVAAIEWQANEFERASGVRCRVVTSQDEVTLDPGRATAVFRIIEQALANVARHAQASSVAVSIAEEDGRLAVSVADNGRGIASRRLEAPTSLGIIGMRERAALLGGMVEIRSARSAGTQVFVTIPLKDRRLVSRQGHAAQWRKPSES